ncbi:O-antigen ligase family protein [Spiribacter onubensis]|uniref:O-antigen ligase family protein n=1 Tax=Spiribacter onubensis TaxID=3122420 RepID=A0ABV3SEC1_9GAMM
MKQTTTTAGAGAPGGLTRSEHIMAAGVFALPALALILDSGYSYGALILLIGAVSHRIAERRTWHLKPALPGLVKAIAAVMVVYAVVWIGDAALRGEGVREFDRPSRFLLAAFCLVVLARSRVCATPLWLGLAAGGIGAGGIAIWQKVIEGKARASGFAQTIQFGNASILFGLMCFAGLVWALSAPRALRLRIALALFFALGGIGGISASFLSGSRGAWLALGPALIIGLWAAWRLGRARRYLLIAPGVLALLVAAVYLHPASGVEQRVTSAIHQLERYVEGSNRSSSVGLRLEMWRGTARLFAERPLTGWGENAYSERLQALGEAGVIHARASRFTHAHNEWFNTLAKKGLIGGVILLALYCAPAAWFLRLGAQASGAPPDRPATPTIALATAGLVFTLGFLATGLTQVNFNHNIGAMLYAFMTAALVGVSTRGKLS